MIEMFEQWKEQKGYLTIIVELQGERTLLVKQDSNLAKRQVWSLHRFRESLEPFRGVRVVQLGRFFRPYAQMVQYQ